MFVHVLIAEKQWFYLLQVTIEYLIDISDEILFVWGRSMTHLGLEKYCD